MAFTLKEQLTQAIEQSRSVAVVLPRAASVDAIGSGLAMARLVASYGRPADVLSADFVAEPHLSFLPGLDAIKNDLHAPRHTVLSIPFSGDLHDLSHEHANGEIKIKITPKNGFLNTENITASHGEWRHDLIIACGASEFKDLGGIHEKHRRFFEETQIVNIDRRPENERFGTINILDLRAAALSELVAEIIEAIDPKRLDPETATCLLAGIIGETKSFRTPNVSPRTLETAGRLVLRGGRREQIIASLFRTRPVAALRLWGRVLARLKADKEHRLVWSLLGREDFLHSGAEMDHLPDVLDELAGRAPDADIICLFHEHPRDPNIVYGIIFAERGWNAMELAAPWHPTGSPKRALFEATGKSLPVFEQETIAALRATVAAIKRG
jgi:nanoRNase/pAp phosphatase (c-di-AMP/oligoRNAs hydrolase)